MHIVRKTLFSAALSMLAAIPSVTLAKDSFTGSEFLTWKHESQHFYIENTIGVASLIATRNAPSHAKCIEDWYYPEQDIKDNLVLDVMKQNPEYHPRGVVLSILEKKCGSFKY